MSLINSQNDYIEHLHSWKPWYILDMHRCCIFITFLLLPLNCTLYIAFLEANLINVIAILHKL